MNSLQIGLRTKSIFIYHIYMMIIYITESLSLVKTMDIETTNTKLKNERNK